MHSAMYPVLHQVLVIFYAALPAAALAWAVARALRRKRPEPMLTYVVTCLSAVIIGTAVIVISAVVYRGRVDVLTVLQTWYFLVALLLTMNVFRWAARQGTWRLLRVP